MIQTSNQATRCVSLWFCYAISMMFSYPPRARPSSPHTQRHFGSRSRRTRCLLPPPKMAALTLSAPYYSYYPQCTAVFDPWPPRAHRPLRKRQCGSVRSLRWTAGPGAPSRHAVGGGGEVIRLNWHISVSLASICVLNPISRELIKLRALDGVTPWPRAAGLPRLTPPPPTPHPELNCTTVQYSVQYHHSVLY